MTDKRPILPHPTDPTLALVELANNRGFSTIDARNAPEVGRYNWRLNVRIGKNRGRTNYALTWRPVTDEGGKTIISLHRFVAGLAGFGDCESVDHIDGNGLMNTESNLRPASQSQNQCNGRLQPNNTSGFVGVSWTRRDKRWRAELDFRGKTLRLGQFRDPATAALVRDTAALEHHGEFAVLNFPRSCPGEKPVPLPCGLGSSRS